MKPRAEQSTGPWWRFGLVWMVVGGPAVVVVAAVTTGVVAWRGADPEVEHSSAAQARVDAKDPLARALGSRDHTATPARASR
jgi:uncharacterized protein